MNKSHAIGWGLSGVLLAVAVWLLWGPVGALYREELMSQHRRLVLNRIRDYGTNLTAVVSPDVHLLNGWARELARHPGEEDFPQALGDFAASLHSASYLTRYLVADLEASERWIFPEPEAEEREALDSVLDVAAQAFRDREVDVNQASLEGPYELFSNEPVMTAYQVVRQEDGAEIGLAGLVIDAGLFLRRSGLDREDSDLHLGLRDEAGVTLQGTEEVWESRPAELEVKLANRTWKLAGVPRNGWDAVVRGKLTQFRVAVLLIVVLILAIFLLLLHQNHRLQRQVQRRTHDLKAKTDELAAAVAAGRKMESLLRESESRFRILVENAPEAIYVQSDFRFAYLNPAALKLFGAEAAEELLGQPVLERSPPEFREIVRDRIRDTMEHRRDAPRLEQTFLRLDGTAVAVEVSAVPIEYQDMAGAMVYAHDITTRKLAEAGLRASERRFRLVLETIQMVAVELDRDARVVYCNDFLLQLTGWRREEVLGAEWFEKFIPAEMQDVIRDVFKSSIEAGRFPVVYENPICTREGKLRHLRWHNTVLRDAEGVVTGPVSLGEDITRHKQTEEKLRQAQKMEAIGQLAGGLAHDFNNVLAAILIHLHLLQQDSNLSDAVRRELKELEEESQRAASMTRQLLLFSRREALHKRPIELNEVIERLIPMLQRLLGENIQLQFERETEELWIHADLGMVEQVVMNLAINARDAMPNSGQLKLRASNRDIDAEAAQINPERRPGRYAVMVVEDTGHGMDEETRQRIFEPFFTTKPKGYGTGLGLASVYGIVKEHGGWIEVDSELERGTRFEVYLKSGREKAREESPAEKAAFTAGGEVVLLVEDERMVRRSIALYLRRLGYEVLEASNAKEACEIWREHSDRVDVLCTDMVLPGETNGLEMAERMRRDNRSLQIILSSGYSLGANHHNLTEERGIHFLAKPYKAPALAKLLRQCLGDKKP